MLVLTSPLLWVKLSYHCVVASMLKTFPLFGQVGKQTVQVDSNKVELEYPMHEKKRVSRYTL